MLIFGVEIDMSLEEKGGFKTTLEEINEKGCFGSEIRIGGVP